MKDTMKVNVVFVNGAEEKYVCESMEYDDNWLFITVSEGGETIKEISIPVRQIVKVIELY